MLKVMDEAMRSILKIEFHSWDENLLFSSQTIIIVIMIIACLFCSLVMCHARRNRDGYTLMLDDETLSHLLNELIPSNAYDKMLFLPAIIELSRKTYNERNIREEHDPKRRLSDMEPHGVELCLEGLEEKREIDKLVLRAGDLSSAWKKKRNG